jgi:hypothetical protein
VLWEEGTEESILTEERDEVTGSCRGLCNEKLHNLYSSRSKITTAESRRM